MVGEGSKHGGQELGGSQAAWLLFSTKILTVGLQVQEGKWSRFLHWKDTWELEVGMQRQIRA